MPTVEDEVAHVQLSGILSKRPVTLADHNASILEKKWSKRFFVIKDGYLLYFAVDEKKEYEKRRCVNYHPKGLMCLGDCRIERVAEGDQKHIIAITNDMSQERLVVSCDSEFEQEQWVDALFKAHRVSSRNLQTLQTFIDTLQTQGERLARERENAYSQYRSEVMAHTEEKEKNYVMEQMVEKMKEEKAELETTYIELKVAFNNSQRDLEEMITQLNLLDAEKRSVAKQQAQLSQKLEQLEATKEQIRQALELTEEKARHYECSHESMSVQSAHTAAELDETLQKKFELQRQLEVIQSEMNTVCHDRQEAEKNALAQSERAQTLLMEKEKIQEGAKALEKSLSEVQEQQSLTEVELKSQVEARIRAEERLKEVEENFQNLEHRLDDASQVSVEQKQEMLRNVKNLRRYFEDKAYEVKISAEKTEIMKISINNKRANIRAKSVLFPDVNGESLQTVVLRRPKLRSVAI